MKRSVQPATIVHSFSIAWQPISACRRPIYEAVSQIDASDANEATQFSLQKLLLSFRLSGVDKDAATRTRIRELSDEITAIGQEFGRNIREDTRYLELDSIDDLKGLPEDYIASHQPNEDGKVLISTQYPDAYPFFEYADNDDLRKEMSLIFKQPCISAKRNSSAQADHCAARTRRAHWVQ